MSEPSLRDCPDCRFEEEGRHPSGHGGAAYTKWTRCAKHAVVLPERDVVEEAKEYFDAHEKRFPGSHCVRHARNLIAECERLRAGFREMADEIRRPPE